MSNKEFEQIQRDFHFSFAELIANIENFGRLCPVDTLLEMCETLAGIMAEQTEIIAAIEATGNNKIKERFSRPLIGERFYSSHLDALCDMMRLAKHLKELSERKGELLKAMKRMERFNVPPKIDVKIIRSTLEAIPRVRTIQQ
jgi:hypothetical protein